jgi:hypothetical protein
MRFLAKTQLPAKRTNRSVISSEKIIIGVFYTHEDEGIQKRKQRRINLWDATTVPGNDSDLVTDYRNERSGKTQVYRLALSELTYITKETPFPQTDAAIYSGSALKRRHHFPMAASPKSEGLFGLGQRPPH